uniref:uncharacterized protein LOC109974157 isoform X2 n=1 Tax=Monopterus albus TaxID=43700 RepID=UPI0009B3E332|nr:uncharacterized protein LOC109974157 isoform X2 [Monopterus albus]
MTRAALIKLFILVILAFIICLPEFFTLYRVSKVSFLCLPYQPCERGNQVKRGEHKKTEDAGSIICDPSQWVQACTQGEQSNMTDTASDSRRGGEDPEKSWFMCQTDTDMARLDRNMSSSAVKIHLEVTVELQLDSSETLNVTLYGYSNYSSLHLYFPEEEEEEKNKGDEGHKEVFYCCLPVLTSSKSARQSSCLLWFSNQTLLTATTKEKLRWKWAHKDEWRCLFRVLWLALLAVVLLAVAMTVFGQIYLGRYVYKKPSVQPVGYSINNQQLNDGEKCTQETPKGTNLHTYASRPWTGLPPIEEADTQEEILLDGNAGNCYTGNLHQRGHPSISALTEEQAW